MQLAMHIAIIQSSVSWADNDYWMLWNKSDAVIDSGQKEKPERRVQGLWNLRGLIWHPAWLTVKGQELWLPILQKCLSALFLPSEIPSLMKPLLLFWMRMSSGTHGMMVGRRPLTVLESWRASQM